MVKNKTKNKYKSTLNQAMLYKHFSGSTCLREDFYEFISGQTDNAKLIKYVSGFKDKEMTDYIKLLDKKYGKKLKEYVKANSGAFDIDFNMGDRYDEALLKNDWDTIVFPELKKYFTNVLKNKEIKSIRYNESSWEDIWHDCEIKILKNGIKISIEEDSNRGIFLTDYMDFGDDDANEYIKETKNAFKFYKEIKI